MTASTSEALAGLCLTDGELQLAARYWRGGLRLESGAEVAAVALAGRGGERGRSGTRRGRRHHPERDRGGLERALLAAKPPRFANDIVTNLIGGGQNDPKGRWPALRAILAGRDAGGGSQAGGRPFPKRPCRPPHSPAHLTGPVGRYVHLDLGGQDYRVYFEEAGSGIPMLLQHTAGCHGSQWRHLFECKEITDPFRLIAYDLPLSR